MSRWYIGLIALLLVGCTSTLRSESLSTLSAAPTQQQPSPIIASSPSPQPPQSLSTSPVPINSPLAREKSCPGASQVKDVTVSSATLGEDIPVRLFIPPCLPAPGSGFLTLYLLHGANADETQWDDVGINEAADAGRQQGKLPPLILVLPRRTEDSTTIRPDDDLPYEHFIVAELIPWVESHTPAQADRADRIIGGISRGGYWALEIAFHHPELFSAVGGHSPAVGGRVQDLLQTHQAAIRSLRVWLDIGDKDSLRQGTADLAASLQAANIPVTYKEWSGGHERPYWRQHTADYLAFYANNLTN